MSVRILGNRRRVAVGRSVKKRNKWSDRGRVTGVRVRFSKPKQGSESYF